MAEVAMIFVVAGMAAAMVAAAFYAGRIHERLAWNLLIREGRLPKPKGG